VQSVYIAPNTLIEVASGDWNGEGALRMQVRRVLHELTAFESGWVWIEGTQQLGERRRNLQAKVRIDALPAPSSD
jgi:hypothetical protein